MEHVTEGAELYLLTIDGVVKSPIYYALYIEIFT